MKNKYASHDINLDIIRCAAISCLFQLHFLLNVNFYDITVNSADTVIMCAMATVFRICVPLFLLLSGYLMYHKQLSTGYYKGIFRILLTYLTASIVCILVLQFTHIKVYTFKSAVLAILSFSGSRYGWYIEMYLGLFILIPFLNMIWEKLDTRKRQLGLIVTLIVLTLVPKMINSFNFQTEGWFMQPSIVRGYNKIFPAWWGESYPITFYFLGAYIRDNNVKLRKPVNAVLLLAAICFFCTTNYLRSRNGLFVAGAPVDWGGLGNTVMSVLTFLLIKDLKFTLKLPPPAKYFISRISYLSLDMYLVSSAADMLLYRHIGKFVPQLHDKLILFPLIISVIFISTAVVSELADTLVISPLTMVSGKLYDNIVKKASRKHEELQQVAVKDDCLSV